MKITLVLTLLFVCFANHLQAQDTSSQDTKSNSAIVIKSTPLPFLFENLVGGNLSVNQTNILFTPLPCSDRDKIFSSLFPCNNHLINNITINFSEVLKMKRRSFLLIFPNRIFIKKITGETYTFSTYRRKRIIDTYKSYKIQ